MSIFITSADIFPHLLLLWCVLAHIFPFFSLFWLLISVQLPLSFCHHLCSRPSNISKQSEPECGKRNEEKNVWNKSIVRFKNSNNGKVFAYMITNSNIMQDLKRQGVYSFLIFFFSFFFVVRFFCLFLFLSHSLQPRSHCKSKIDSKKQQQQ